MLPRVSKRQSIPQVHARDPLYLSHPTRPIYILLKQVTRNTGPAVKATGRKRRVATFSFQPHTGVDLSGRRLLEDGWLLFLLFATCLSSILSFIRRYRVH